MILMELIKITKNIKAPISPIEDDKFVKIIFFQKHPPKLLVK